MCEEVFGGLAWDMSCRVRDVPDSFIASVVRVVYINQIPLVDGPVLVVRCYPVTRMVSTQSCIH